MKLVIKEKRLQPYRSVDQKRCEYYKTNQCDYGYVYTTNFDHGEWCAKHAREVIKLWLEVGCY